MPVSHESECLLEDVNNLNDIYKQVFHKDTNLWISWSSNQTLYSLYHLYSKFCSSLGYLHDRVQGSEYLIPYLSYYYNLANFNLLTDNCRMVTIFEVDTTTKNIFKLIGFISAEITPGLYVFRNIIFFDSKYYTSDYIKEVIRLLYVWILAKYSRNNKKCFPMIQVASMLPKGIDLTEYVKDLYPIYKLFMYNCFRISDRSDMSSVFDSEPVILKHVDISNLQNYVGTCNKLIEDSEKHFIADASASGENVRFIPYTEQDYLYYYLNFMKDHDSHLAFIYLKESNINEPIGLIEYFTPNNRPAFIHKIYLDPQYRKQGYGTSILKQIFFILSKDLDILPMHDLVVYEANKSVLQFYEKLNYHIYSIVLMHHITKKDYDGLMIVS